MVGVLIDGNILINPRIAITAMALPNPSQDVGLARTWTAASIEARWDRWGLQAQEFTIAIH